MNLDSANQQLDDVPFQLVRRVGQVGIDFLSQAGQNTLRRTDVIGCVEPASQAR